MAPFQDVKIKIQFDDDNIDNKIDQIRDHWNDAFESLADMAFESLSPDIDMDDVFKTIDAVENALKTIQVPNIDWDQLLDRTGLNSVNDIWDNIFSAMQQGLSESDMETFANNIIQGIDSCVKGATISPPTIDTDGIQAQTLEIFNIINTAFSQYGVNTSLESLFNKQFDNLSDTIDQLSNKDLSNLNTALNDIYLKISGMKYIDQDIQLGMMEELEHHLELIGSKLRDINSISSINQAISDTLSPNLAAIKSIQFTDIGDIKGFGDFENQIKDLNENQLQRLYDMLVRTRDIIDTLGLDPNLYDKLTQNLDKYTDSLQDAIDGMNDMSKTGSEDVMDFLDKYKYSLGLIGGALGVIYGLTQKSAVFGGVIDTVGSLLGAVADIMLMQLWPIFEVIIFALMAATVWFMKLPDPIKTVISGIAGLAIAFGVLNAVMKFFGFSGILASLSKMIAAMNAAMAAGGLTGGLAFAGALLGGILLGLAGAYILMKLGGQKALAAWGEGFQKDHHMVMAGAIIASTAVPIGFLGIIINDLLSNKIDQIPYHFDIAFKMAIASTQMLAKEFIKAFVSMSIAAADLGINIGKILQNNPLSPLTKGAGKDLEDFFTNSKINAQAIIDQQNIEIQGKNDYLDQLRAIAQYGNQAWKPEDITSGDIFNSLFSDNQMSLLLTGDQYSKAMDESNKANEKALEESTASIVSSINSASTQNINAANKTATANATGSSNRNPGKLERSESSRLSYAEIMALHAIQHPQNVQKAVEQITENPLQKAVEKTVPKPSTPTISVPSLQVPKPGLPAAAATISTTNNSTSPDFIGQIINQMLPSIVTGLFGNPMFSPLAFKDILVGALEMKAPSITPTPAATSTPPPSQWTYVGKTPSVPTTPTNQTINVTITGGFKDENDLYQKFVRRLEQERRRYT